MAKALTQEHRIAVVMSGGISLAIYMNGIAQELLALVRATSPNNEGPLTGTDVVYRKLAGELGCRFSVDIISGSSAGGINGVFLAKALATGADMSTLKNMWVEEGDFAKILNDRGAIDGLSLPQQKPPKSILSGERMYLKLLAALDGMDQQSGTKAYVEDVTLAVTTTDIYGKVVALQLADGNPVSERNYKQSFRFRYSEKGGDNNDFTPVNTPFLAFAARCTSSFPVAFEPMQLDSVQRLIPLYTPPKGRGNPSWMTIADWRKQCSDWEQYFAVKDGTGSVRERYFADGGYLDNHPFDHAIDALASQSSVALQGRTLFYIEPSPGHPNENQNPRGADGKLLQPDAISNAWSALSGIPTQQPIRESILRLQERNRLIEKVNDVVSAAVLDLDSIRDGSENNAYLRLRASSVTDDFARRLASILGCDVRSDDFCKIRQLVKQWRDSKVKVKVKGKVEVEDWEPFLEGVDISYSVRRIQFLKSQLLYMVSDGAQREKRLKGFGLEWSGTEEDLVKGIDKIRGYLHEAYLILRGASRAAKQPGGLKLPGEFLKEVRRKIADENASSGVFNFDPLVEAIKEHYGPKLKDSSTQIVAAWGEEKLVEQKLLKQYFENFPTFDSIVFPLTYGTDSTVLVPVEIARISPEDATQIQDEAKTGRPKLAGAALGSFGAFLDKTWRQNDILWGRLDGAERLIRVLGRDLEESMVVCLIRQAHRAIIAEDLFQKQNEGLRMAIGGTDVASLLRELETFQVNRDLDRIVGMKNLARAVKITGKMLEDAGRGTSTLSSLGKRLAQAGSVLWGLVEVATPGVVRSKILNYWFGLLILFSLVMIGFGTVASTPLQTAGVKLFALLVATRGLVELLRHFLEGRKRLVWEVAILTVAAILGLGAYWGYSLRDWLAERQASAAHRCFAQSETCK